MANKKAFSTLATAVPALYPDLADPAGAIASGQVLVDGFPVTNPASVVGPGSRITLRSSHPLRGEAKLKAALERFQIPVAGRVALDIGAAAGGFTRTLLYYGARRVYAVDAGHGQLLGSLRQDARVVNLEATNLGDLDQDLIAETIELITMDVSYLSLTAAVPQLAPLTIAQAADLVALVKPMFELHLSMPPDDQERLQEALAAAIRGIEAAGWTVIATMDSPVQGARGAVEFLIHARRPAVRGEPSRAENVGFGTAIKGAAPHKLMSGSSCLYHETKPYD